MKWEELTAPEFERAVKEIGVCVLSVGCLEKHFDHLPLGQAQLGVLPLRVEGVLPGVGVADGACDLQSARLVSLVVGSLLVVGGEGLLVHVVGVTQLWTSLLLLAPNQGGHFLSHKLDQFPLRNSKF